VLPGHGGEGLIRALQDSLRPDVDPASGGHLAEHGQPHGLQPAELVPGRPPGDDEGIGDEDARRFLVGFEDGHGLSGLDGQRLVVIEVPEALDEGPETFPVPGRFSRSAVDDELLGLLGNLGIEVVHQHAEGGFLGPSFGLELGAPGRFYRGICGFGPVTFLGHSFLLIRDYTPK